MEACPIELVLGLFVVIVALAYLARRVGMAYPILLVLGGLVLGFAPGLPAIQLQPDVVFLLLLPPILFAAGYSTPIRDFKANARPIALLAIGLVLFTTVVVAVSQATRALGSSRMIESRMASETWSHILSGWPSVTDSDVKE